jgi:sterol 24-C-methyltransferase
VLDVGAGIGGPLRELAALSGASITGLNNNTHQVERGNKILSACQSLPHCKMVQGDFMEVPFAENTFNHAYQIEATCHAPDTTAAYREILRTLKPGGMFASYEWCLTDKFDPNNAEYCSIKENIMVGNGLPELRHYSVVVRAVQDAGFEVLDARDLAHSSEVPWYQPIDPNRPLTLEQFKTTWLGRNITHYAVWLLELLRIAPKGTMSTSSFLKKGADGLVAGGKAGIYTTMFFTLCRKLANE